MVKITSQLDEIKNAEDFDELKKVVYLALTKLNEDRVDPEVVKRVQMSMSGIISKLDSLQEKVSDLSSGGGNLNTISQDIVQLKADVSDINDKLRNKVEHKELNEAYSSIRKVIDGEVTRLYKTIGNFPDISIINEMSAGISTELDNIKEAVSLKADAKTVNEMSKLIDKKADRALVKSDISVIKETLSDLKRQGEASKKTVKQPVKPIVRQVRAIIPDRKSDSGDYITQADLISGTYLKADMVGEPTESGYRKVYPNSFKLTDDLQIAINTNELYQISFVGFNKKGQCINTPTAWLCDGVYSSMDIGENARTFSADSYSFQIKRVDNARLLEDVYSGDFLFIEKATNKEERK